MWNRRPRRFSIAGPEIVTQNNPCPLSQLLLKPLMGVVGGEFEGRAGDSLTKNTKNPPVFPSNYFTFPFSGCSTSPAAAFSRFSRMALTNLWA